VKNARPLSPRLLSTLILLIAWSCLEQGFRNRLSKPASRTRDHGNFVLQRKQFVEIRHGTLKPHQQRELIEGHLDDQHTNDLA